MRGIILFLGLIGCADVNLCEHGGWVADERSSQISLADAPDVQVLMPAKSGRYPEGAPAVVFLRGGWSETSLPAQNLDVHFGSGRGVVHLYLDLFDDLRGAASRAAVAAVLRYAAGEELDEQNCGIEQRSGIPFSGELVIAGFSNGGNLAWSTLADPTLELPEVDGVAMFETPISAQMVLFDLMRTPYETGMCALNDSSSLSCDVPYEDMSASKEGQLWVRNGAENTALGGVWDPDSGLWIPSPQAAAAAETAGLQEVWLADSAHASAFWQEREAPQHVQAAVERFPDLAVVVAATETDHAQAGLVDAPHITGMLAALTAGGVRWHRLNPDAAYAVLETGAADANAEHPANTVFSVSDRPVLMPESVGAGRGLLTASVLEIMDRSHEDQWEADLQQVLYR